MVYILNNTSEDKNVKLTLNFELQGMEPVGEDCTDNGEGKYTCILTTVVDGYDDYCTLLRKEGRQFSYALG